MTSRKSKIAHLPRTLRDELNQHLDNGVPGPQLLAWLNSEPMVKEILAQYFEGRPITKQNLSEWRNGGYQDWFKLQETRDLTLQLAEQPDDLTPGISPKKITDAYAIIAAADFVRTSEARYHDCTTTSQRWECMGNIQRQLSRLRHDDHRAACLDFRQERWDYQVARDRHPVETTRKSPEVQASPAKSMQNIFNYHADCQRSVPVIGAGHRPAIKPQIIKKCP